MIRVMPSLTPTKLGTTTKIRTRAAFLSGKSRSQHKSCESRNLSPSRRHFYVTFTFCAVATFVVNCRSPSCLLMCWQKTVIFHEKLVFVYFCQLALRRNSVLDSGFDLRPTPKPKSLFTFRLDKRIFKFLKRISTFSLSPTRLWRPESEDHQEEYVQHQIPDIWRTWSEFQLLNVTFPKFSTLKKWRQKWIFEFSTFWPPVAIVPQFLWNNSLQAEFQGK